MYNGTVFAVCEKTPIVNTVKQKIHRIDVYNCISGDVIAQSLECNSKYDCTDGCVAGSGMISSSTINTGALSQARA